LTEGVVAATICVQRLHLTFRFGPLVIGDQAHRNDKLSYLLPLLSRFNSLLHAGPPTIFSILDKNPGLWMSAAD
jgi:hypothetical protein